jgi:hypothetical protein
VLFETATVTLALFEQAASVGVSETVSALSDLLNSQPITARQAADKAVADGVDLPYGTIAGYWAGKHGRRAAWGKPAPLGPYRPTKESVHLTDQQRRALDQLIKSIVQIGAAHADQPSSPADPPAEPDAPTPADKGQEAERRLADDGEDDATVRLRQIAELDLHDRDHRGQQSS